MIEAVALDLDDTLYLERDFVRSGFRAVAARLAERVDPRRDWFAELWRGFEAGVRGDAFNRVLAAARVKVDAALVEDLVRCYREHRPTVRPPEDVVPALEALGLAPDRLGVISDGPVAMQRGKLAALGLERFFGHVIVTDAWGPEFRKPHPRAFVEFERRTATAPGACAYVADNPAKDFVAPKGRGWTTVRIIRPGGLHAAEPSAPGEVDRTVRDLRELRTLPGLERA
jgi:putative hydrolase of the HAD superfamily